jgi:DNA-binding MarR family transcriptional regulator
MKTTMKTKTDNPYAALKRVFHEPSRMAIMADLCAEEHALAFAELKQRHGLTDGNLNRHLKALHDAGAVRVYKRPDGSKQRTMIVLTDQGRLHFVDYLRALEDALRRAAASLAADEQRAPTPHLVPLEWAAP